MHCPQPPRMSGRRSGCGPNWTAPKPRIVASAVWSRPGSPTPRAPEDQRSAAVPGRQPCRHNVRPPAAAESPRSRRAQTVVQPRHSLLGGLPGPQSERGADLLVRHSAGPGREQQGSLDLVEFGARRLQQAQACGDHLAINPGISSSPCRQPDQFTVAGWLAVGLPRLSAQSCGSGGCQGAAVGRQGCCHLLIVVGHGAHSEPCQHDVVNLMLATPCCQRDVDIIPRPAGSRPPYEPRGRSRGRGVPPVPAVRRPCS